MTNKDKYLKDGVDIEKMAEEMVDLWNFPPCEGICPADIVDYFNMKTKPTLTEDERVILRNTKWKGYSATHIGRARENKGSFIYIRFENDIEMTYYFDNFFGHLFQFIKERRRISNRGTIEIKYAHLPGSRKSLRTRTRKQTPCACADY